MKWLTLVGVGLAPNLGGTFLRLLLFTDRRESVRPVTCPPPPSVPGQAVVIQAPLLCRNGEVLVFSQFTIVCHQHILDFAVSEDKGVSESQRCGIMTGRCARPSLPLHPDAIVPRPHPGDDFNLLRLSSQYYPTFFCFILHGLSQ